MLNAQVYVNKKALFVMNKMEIVYAKSTSLLQ
jgi:hypothetical protein